MFRKLARNNKLLVNNLVAASKPKQQQYRYKSQQQQAQQKSFVGFTSASLAASAALMYYYFNKEEEKAQPFDTVYAAEKKRDFANVQTSVFSDMHPHCAIVTIRLAPNPNRYEILNAVSRLEGVIKSLRGKEDLDASAADEDHLPNILAGIGFATSLWESWAGADARIRPVKVQKHYQSRNGMPATGGDMIIHVKAASQSQCFEAVQAILNLIPKKCIASVEDNYGWKYKDGRDLSGFLDGTVNPSGAEDRFDAAVLPNGGSFLLHQVWHHDLDALAKHSVADQEQFVGRKKDFSAELSQLPATSHVARTRDAQGNIIPIVRQSMPFGTMGGNKGLLFIAYSNSLDKFDTMLDRMTGAVSDGKSDAIFKFTRCVTGQYYYLPSVSELKAMKK